LDGSDDRSDRFHDECGVFGIFGHGEAANLAYLGIHALQHRGQESAGIAAVDQGKITLHKGMGLVADVFSDKGTLSRLPGSAAIGHTRYSTAGQSVIENAQPMVARTAAGPVAVAHNGNLVNAEELRAELSEQGALFTGSSDTEVLVHLYAREREGDTVARIQQALARVRGAYSLLFLTDDALVAVRDPLGFRPLVLGRLRGAWVFASETCALDLIDAEYIRELEPGEMVVVDGSGLRTVQRQSPQRQGQCVFELVYFARPDSKVFGRQVYGARKELGRRLALECPADADVVIPVPDSGVPAALGYSEKSGIPYDLGLIRSHYVGRTFIEPSQSIRNFGVKLKLNPVPEVVKGKRVVVVDDSIVRGTTSRKIVKMIRDAGAREVHLRISAPPTRWPCYYGIDTPVRSELIAASHSIDEIARYVTADSLGYLSREGMHEAVKAQPRGFCDACFSGEYLVQLTPLEVAGVGGEHAPRSGKPTGTDENVTLVRA
jgi:amidophosphoribosyltransferase